MNIEILAIFAIVLALGLVAAIAVELSSIVQEAEAKGCPAGTPTACRSAHRRAARSAPRRSR